jgi:hypothetical protein
VLGRDVPVSVLCAIVGLSADVVQQSLHHLQAQEFLYASYLVPEYP